MRSKTLLVRVGAAVGNGSVGRAEGDLVGERPKVGAGVVIEGEADGDSVGRLKGADGGSVGVNIFGLC